MKKIIVLNILMFSFKLIEAQIVRSLYQEGNEIENELTVFPQNDAKLLQEVNIIKDSHRVVNVFKYSGSIDSTTYHINSNRFQYWRNGVIIIEGEVNPNEVGNANESGARKGNWIFKYNNGSVLATGSYDDFGNKIGRWLFYYPNMQLKKIENYLLFDDSISWDIDSNKVWHVRESKLDGDFFEYFQDGQEKVIGKYKSEVVLRDSAYLVDYQEDEDVFDPTLQRVTKGYILTTRKSGKWLYYDNRRKLIKEVDYN